MIQCASTYQDTCACACACACVCACAWLFSINHWRAFSLRTAVLPIPCRFGYPPVVGTWVLTTRQEVMVCTCLITVALTLLVRRAQRTLRLIRSHRHSDLNTTPRYQTYHVELYVLGSIIFCFPVFFFAFLGWGSSLKRHCWVEQYIFLEFNSLDANLLSITLLCPPSFSFFSFFLFFFSNFKKAVYFLFQTIVREWCFCVR